LVGCFFFVFCLFIWFVDWLVVSLFLIGWLIGWLVGWSVGWLVDWLVVSSFVFFVYLFGGRLLVETFPKPVSLCVVATFGTALLH
jgi:hypothetical protein